MDRILGRKNELVFPLGLYTSIVHLTRLQLVVIFISIGITQLSSKWPLLLDTALRPLLLDTGRFRIGLVSTNLLNFEPSASDSFTPHHQSRVASFSENGLE